MLLAASVLNWEAILPYLRQQDIQLLKSRNNGKLDYKLLRDALHECCDIYCHLVVTMLYSTEGCEDMLILATCTTGQHTCSKIPGGCVLSMPILHIPDLIYAVLKADSPASGILRKQVADVMRGISSIDNTLLKKYYYRNGNLYEHNSTRR